MDQHPDFQAQSEAGEELPQPRTGSSATDFFRVLDTQITPHVDMHKVLIVLSGGKVLVRRDLERIGLEFCRRKYP